MQTHPSFRNESVRLLFEAVRRLLGERGYKRRDLTWYSHSPAVIRVLRFDPGMTRFKMRFALGIALHALDSADDPTVWDSVRPLRCRATHPQIEDCAVSVRLERLLEDRTHYEELADFGDRTRSYSDSIPKIVEVVSSRALPFLESFSTLDDVRRFVQSDRASSVTIREAAKKILCT